MNFPLPLMVVLKASNIDLCSSVQQCKKRPCSGWCTQDIGVEAPFNQRRLRGSPMIRSWLDDFRRDSTYGLRLLQRSPAFAAVALTTLAVGIGATVTMFSIVDAWLLKPLAFPHADRIVVGLAATRERPTEPAVFLPYRSYPSWKAPSRSFDVVSATFRRS